MRFQEQLQAISQASIHDDASWAQFCNFVAAVGAGELVNTHTMTATQRIQGNPDDLIKSLARIRNSGVCAIQACHFDMTCLTQPANYFASIVSTLKLGGAHQTANAVKCAAKKYWDEVEQFFQKAQTADSDDAVHIEQSTVMNELESTDQEDDLTADFVEYTEKERQRRERNKTVLKAAGIISLACALLSIINRT